MPCGFFRGTTEEQDSRFSNKQAKLLKSQKFARELEKVVDVTKVKMDVMRPWIATRVTELLGFEDDVVINFIYGLLDGKAVNGKEIQIAITGFMEKNTAKFMKELWTLVLSAQNNSSGVPQQFLDDAKEAETKKKEEEAIELRKRGEEEPNKLEHRSRSSSLRRSLSPQRSPARHLSPPSRRRRSPSPRTRRRRSPSPPARRKRSRSPPAKGGRSDLSGRSWSPVARPLPIRLRGLHKRSDREEVSSDDNADLKAKRRRKEEKKTRREEKKSMLEERRGKREESRAFLFFRARG